MGGCVGKGRGRNGLRDGSDADEAGGPLDGEQEGDEERQRQRQEEKMEGGLLEEKNESQSERNEDEAKDDLEAHDEPNEENEHVGGDDIEEENIKKEDEASRKRLLNDETKAWNEPEPETAGETEERDTSAKAESPRLGRSPDEISKRVLTVLAEGEDNASRVLHSGEVGIAQWLLPPPEKTQTIYASSRRDKAILLDEDILGLDAVSSWLLPDEKSRAQSINGDGKKRLSMQSGRSVSSSRSTQELNLMNPVLDDMKNLVARISSATSASTSSRKSSEKSNDGKLKRSGTSSGFPDSFLAQDEGIGIAGGEEEDDDDAAFTFR